MGCRTHTKGKQNKRASIKVLGFSFILFCLIFITSSAYPATYTKTWTSQGDFENNASTTGTPATPYQVDTSSEAGKVKISTYGDQAYTEDFSTGTFMDSANTTAEWGTIYPGVPGTVTDLRRNILEQWGADDAVIASTYAQGRIYVGTANGGFGYIQNDIGYDITDSISSIFNSKRINVIVYDGTGKLYLGGGELGDPKFIEYDIQTATANDLSSLLPAAWNAPEIKALLFTSYGGVDYIYIGTTGGTFGRYNRTTGSVEDLTTTSGIRTIMGFLDILSLAVDSGSVNKEIYIGAQDGIFVRFSQSSGYAADLTNRISSFWDSNYDVQAMAVDAADRSLYLGGRYTSYYGRFARYDIQSDTANDLSNILSNTWGSKRPVLSISFAQGQTTDFIYLGNSNYGKLLKFDITTQSGTDLTSVISGFWKEFKNNSKHIYTMAADSGNGKIYIGGELGMFGRLGIETDIAEDLVGTLDAICRGNGINAIGYDSINDSVYIYSLRTSDYNHLAGRYNLYDGTFESIYLGSLITSMAFDSIKGEMYLGAKYAGLYKYNPQQGQLYDISADSGLKAAWGNAYIESAAFDDYHGIIYLGTGYLGSPGVSVFGKFDPNDTTAGQYGTFTDLSGVPELSGISWVKVAFASYADAQGGARHEIYIGSYTTEKLVKYDTDTGLFQDVTLGRPGYMRVRSLAFDSINKKLYIGVASGMLYRYDVITGTYEDLTPKVSSYFSGQYNTLAFDEDNNVLFLASSDSSFVKYEIGASFADDKAIDVFPEITAYWSSASSTSVIYAGNGRVFVGGNNGGAALFSTPPVLIAQSLNINDPATRPTAPGSDVGWATLSAIDDPGSVGTIAYYLSNDGGQSFYQVQPDVQYTFPASGSDLRWQAALTGDSNIQNISITYSGFNSLGYIEGLKIDAGADVEWVNLSWNATLNGGLVKFQTRSADTEANLAAQAWSFPEYTVSGSSITSPLNRWLELKLQLETSDATKTPVLDDVSIVYAVNAPPDITNIVVSEDSSGVVQISYDLKDIDTNDGTIQPGKADVSFQYWDGSNWQEAAATTGEEKKSVQQTQYITYAGTWDAKQDFDDRYVANCKIRITADDKEAIYNIGTGASASFGLDTKSPSAGSVSINAGASKTNSQAVALALSVTDDTLAGMEMILSESSGFSGAAYEAYSASKAYTLTSGDGAKTVYIKYRDKYGNESSIFNDVIELDTIPPAIPQNLTIYDISAGDNGGLFVKWDTVVDTDGDFAKYNIWRSTDGFSYGANPYATIANAQLNYFIDESLDSGSTYYYKLTSEDDIGNISADSDIVALKPGGSSGGEDVIAPVISSVSVSGITNNSAVISWITDELSDSTVGYSLDSTYSNEVGSPTMTVSHSVTLSGLSPNTAYRFRVKSLDAFNNQAIDDNNGAGYSFTTTADTTGPVISAIDAVSITKDSVAITWTTDEPATSQVQYGTGGSYDNTTALDTDLELAHSAVITGLSPSTGYSYIVLSTDGSGNQSVSSTFVFTTLEDTTAGTGEGSEAAADTTAPVISSVTAASIGTDSAAISWTTDEAATSQVDYGTGISYGNSTTLDSDLELSHSVSISNLFENTTYHYKVKSRDASGNESVSADYTFTTLEDNTEDSGVSRFLTLVGSIFRRSGRSERDKAKNKGVSDDKEGGYAVKAERIDELSILGPGGPVAEDISTTEATISWTTNVPANSIVVFRPQSEGSESMDMAFVNAGSFKDFVTEHSVNLKGLHPNTTYEFRVKSMDTLGKVGLSDINGFDTLSEPTIFEVKAYDIRSDSAAISWRTNIPATSNVEYGFDAAYGKKAFKKKKKLSFNTLHIVRLEDLESGTAYHYRAVSTDLAGHKLISDDMAFKTPPSPGVEEYSILQLTPDKAVVSWKTNVETDSMVKYTPYRRRKLRKAEAMIQGRAEYTKEHEVALTNLELGITYDIEIEGKDKYNNVVVKKLPRYTVKADERPLEISQVRSRNAILPGTEEKIQTIISWQTSRPATSQAIYQMGVKKNAHYEIRTPLDANLTTNHTIVLTSLKPATIYRFNVAGVDGFNNTAESKDYTLLTPQKKKGIIQVIMESFEERFGWLKKLQFGK